MIRQNGTSEAPSHSRSLSSFSKSLAGISLALSFCILSSSCAYFSQYENIRNSRNLRVGMTKQQVLEVMGEPLRDKKFSKPDVWFYYVDTVWHDFLVTEDECMPLVFEDGALVGWGNEFYNRMQVPPRPSQ